MGGRGKKDPNAGINTGEGSAEAIEKINAETTPAQLQQMWFRSSGDSNKKDIEQELLEALNDEIEQQSAGAVGTDQSASSLVSQPTQSQAQADSIPTTVQATTGNKRRGRPPKVKETAITSPKSKQSLQSILTDNDVPEILTAPIDEPLAVQEDNSRRFTELSPEEQAELLTRIEKFKQELQLRNRRPKKTTSTPKPQIQGGTQQAPSSPSIKRGKKSVVSASIGKGGKPTTEGRRDKHLFPYLSPKDKLNHAPIDLNTGQPITTEAYRRSFSNCFYCDALLYHDYSINDRRDEDKSRRRSIVEHVYSNDLAIRYAPDRGQAQNEAQQSRNSGTPENEIKSPEWWNNYLRDARGLVCACARCNGSKGTQTIEEWEPSYTLRLGAKNEAKQKSDLIKKEHKFTGP